MSPDSVQMAFPLLSLLVWLPILGGALCLLLGNDRPQAARWVGLATALAALVLSVPLLTGFDMGSAAMQFVEQRAVDPDLRHPLSPRRRWHLGAR